MSRSPLTPMRRVPRAARDRGFSLTEVLVTISLMGVAVVAVLVGLRMSIQASVIDRDHATAFSWLQAASDEIYRTDREPCTSGQAAVISTYDAAAKSVDLPPVWLATSASIAVDDVEFLGRADVDDDFEWSDSYCFEGVGFDDSPLYTQRVTITVTGPDARFTKTIQMVKSQ